MPTSVTIDGYDCIKLNDCYVFRDGLAHKADVSIASAVSYTDNPHLFQIDTSVPGSKKLSLRIGIPFPELLKLIRHALFWDEYVKQYDACKLELVRHLFQCHITDLSVFPWTQLDLNTVQDFEATNDLQTEVQDDLLKIAQASLEGASDE